MAATIVAPSSIAMKSLDASFKNFSLGDVDQGRADFRKACSELQDAEGSVFYNLWVIHGKPEGNPTYGEDAFYDHHPSQSTAEEKARAVYQYITRIRPQNVIADLSSGCPSKPLDRCDRWANRVQLGQRVVHILAPNGYYVHVLDYVGGNGDVCFVLARNEKPNENGPPNHCAFPGEKNYYTENGYKKLGCYLVDPNEEDQVRVSIDCYIESISQRHVRASLKKLQQNLEYTLEKIKMIAKFFLAIDRLGNCDPASFVADESVDLDLNGQIIGELGFLGGRLIKGLSLQEGLLVMNKALAMASCSVNHNKDLIVTSIEAGRDLMRAFHDPGSLPASDPILQRVERFREKGLGTEAQDPLILHQLIAEGSLKRARELMEQGASVDVVDENGASILHLALSKKADLEFIEYLLKKGVDVNLVMTSGSFPLAALHIATRANNFRLIEMLFAYGADVNVRGGGFSPLHLACMEGVEDCIVDLYLAKGAEVSALEGINQSTPLHVASSANRFNLVSKLINAGADVDAQDQFGQTPLHYAVVSGYLETVKALIEHDANCTLADQEGATPLILASIGGNQAIEKEILVAITAFRMTRILGRAADLITSADGREIAVNAALNVLADTHVTQEETKEDEEGGSCVIS